MSTVKVKVTKNGDVITQNADNDGYGYFLVETANSPITFGTNGWANIQRKRQALVSAQWDVLQSMVKDGIDLGNGKIVKMEEGAELPGKIVIFESLNPYDLPGVNEFKADGVTPTEVKTEQFLKYASAAHREADVNHTLDDQPIYRVVRYTTDLNVQDVRVQHNNQEQIKAFRDAQIAKGNTNLVAGFTPAKRTGATVKK